MIEPRLLAYVVRAANNANTAPNVLSGLRVPKLSRRTSLAARPF